MMGTLTDDLFQAARILSVPEHIELADRLLAAAESAAAVPQGWAELLKSAENNYHHNFGYSVAAAWIYNDLRELFAVDRSAATPVPAVQEPEGDCPNCTPGRRFCTRKQCNEAAALEAPRRSHEHTD